MTVNVELTRHLVIKTKLMVICKKFATQRLFMLVAETSLGFHVGFSFSFGAILGLNANCFDTNKRTYSP